MQKYNKIYNSNEKSIKSHFFVPISVFFTDIHQIVQYSALFHVRFAGKWFIIEFVVILDRFALGGIFVTIIFSEN